MANTLTDLTPDLYSALDVVSRELTGFIPAVSSDMTTARAAKDQTVRSFVAPASSAGDITPAATTPDDGDQTIGNVDLSITKARTVPFRWNGEQTLAMNSGGPGVANIRRDQIAQAMRTLVNEIETDLAALHIDGSRAYGTAGTTPFASDLAAAAQVRKILSDNGTPLSDLQLVLDTAAGAKMRTLGQLSKDNEAGGDSLLRQGVLLDIHGFSIRESAQVKQAVTVGTGANYLINEAGNYAVGATSLTLDTGTGTILAGDVITIGSYNYVVDTALAANVVVINAPGLRAVVLNNDTVTVVAAAARNMAFDRSAIVLATRLPALPDGGDLASDRMTITDPRSGLSFEIAMYPQYRQMRYEVSCAWGVKVVKRAHTALLLG